MAIVVILTDNRHGYNAVKECPKISKNSSENDSGFNNNMEDLPAQYSFVCEEECRNLNTAGIFEP